MTPLILATLIFAVGAYLSYSPAYRSHPRMWVVFVLLGGCAAYCWSWAIRGQPQAAVYRLGLAWDGLALLAYYIAPAVLTSVEFTPGQWLGAGMVGLGLVLVHVAGE